MGSWNLCKSVTSCYYENTRVKQTISVRIYLTLPGIHKTKHDEHGIKALKPLDLVVNAYFPRSKKHWYVGSSLALNGKLCKTGVFPSEFFRHSAFSDFFSKP